MNATETNITNSLREFLSVIKKIRKEKGISQSELAEKSDISFRTYQRIETGEIFPKTDILLRIVNVLGMDTLRILVDIFRNDNHYELEKSHQIQIQNIRNVKNQMLDSPALFETAEIEVIKKFHALNSTSNFIGYWEWDINAGTFYGSDEIYEIYGLKKGVASSFQEFQKLIVPEDLPEMERSLNNLFQYGWTYHNVHRAKVNGIVKTIRSTARVMPKNNGQIIFGISEVIRN